MASRCYISLPYGVKGGVDFNSLRERLVAPALAQCGYEPIEAHDLFSNSSVMDVTVRLIAESELMIADISLHNANVLHEIGIRQALLPTGLLFIRCRRDEVPFNLRNFYYYEYDPEAPEMCVDRLAWAITRISQDKSANSVYRTARYARDYEEHQVAIQEFHAVAPYERSIFIMTKFHETNPRKQSDEDGKLERVIQNIRSSVDNQGFTARLASDRIFNPLLWKNIEIYLLGCSRGIAVVENKYEGGVNPNVAMEWGWMRSARKEVLYLLEETFENRRADFTGFLSERFSWDFPERAIPDVVSRWLQKPYDQPGSGGH